jgi:hypothetical protein
LGQAKQRSNAAEAWRNALPKQQKVIAEVCERVFGRFVVPAKATGMCYRLAFFLTTLLRVEHGIEVEPGVGYVNDGDGEAMASHAWIEFANKRTDLSLAFTEHPDVQHPGEVLILDRVVRAGHRYTYHRSRTPTALAAAAYAASDTRFAEALAQKEAEHIAMVARAKYSQLMRAYLDAAPDGFDFERLAGLVRAA